MKLAKQWNFVGPLCVLTYKKEVYSVPDNWASLQGKKKTNNVQHLFQCDDQCSAGIIHQYKSEYAQSW